MIPYTFIYGIIFLIGFNHCVLKSRGNWGLTLLILGIAGVTSGSLYFQIATAPIGFFYFIYYVGLGKGKKLTKPMVM